MIEIRYTSELSKELDKLSFEARKVAYTFLENIHTCSKGWLSCYFASEELHLQAGVSFHDTYMESENGLYDFSLFLVKHAGMVG